MDSICRFIPAARTSENIHIINFVYESSPQNIRSTSPNPVYRMFYVTDGVGDVECAKNKRRVKKGDIFFNFPAVPYGIVSGEKFSYMYISFVGIRANVELEKFGINSTNFVFEGYDELEEIWKQSITDENEIINLTSESVLLYTLSRIGNRTLHQKKETLIGASRVSDTLLKAYIDENYTNPELSLATLSKHFSYTKKYISSLFKKHFKIGFSEYLNIVRINQACVLINEGHKNVSELATKTGFRDALYFSKVFKQKMGISPKKYIMQSKS